MLYNIFDIAIKNDIMIKNPCNGVTKPSIQQEDRRVLSVSEQERLLKFIQKEQWKFYEPTIAVMLGTGVRVGELQALMWNDVDFDNKTISINKTLVYVKNRDTKKFQFEMQSTKTKTGKRIIPMQKNVEMALKRQGQNQNYLRLQGRWKPLENFQNLIFAGTLGQPQQRGAVQSLLNKIVKAMNDEEMKNSQNEKRPPVYIEHLYPHALRHSFATRCFEVDIPPKTVQMLLGHASIQMTLDLYTHVSEIKKQEDMKKLDKVFKNVT